MTEAEVITAMREHLEKLFPQDCPNCKRRFRTLREFLVITKQVGSAIPYDALAGDWQPLKPLGTMTFFNCPCGSTIALTSEGMPLFQLWSLLAWAKIETQRRHMTPEALLNYLREEICKQVLAEPNPPDSLKQG